MMEKGQLILVDGRPAEFSEYMEDADGYYVTYRSLRDPPGVEHCLSMNSVVVRLRHVREYRT